MPAYLGKPGALLPIPKVYQIEVAEARPSSEKVSMGGRVVEFRAPKSRRSWDLSLRADTAGSLAGFQSLLLATKPPWALIDQLAQVTNCLSPEQSVLDSGTWSGVGLSEGGSAVASDGAYAARTVAHASGGTIALGYRNGFPDRLPVVPGTRVVGSVYARGSGLLRVSFRDWTGTTLTDVTTPFTNTGLSRVVRAALVPNGAVSVQMTVEGATLAGLPAFTWTAAAVPWAVGRGCNRVTVKGSSESLESASLRRVATSLTIQELG